MARNLILYNHKGGVSKTTTTYNLGHALAEYRRKKVLLVDGDPQCNLTELVLAHVLQELDERVERNGDLGELPGTSVLEALAPRLHGERAEVDVDAIELCQPETDHEVYLLRGDIGLNEAEDQLSYAHSQRLTTNIHERRNYVAIHDMLRRLGDRDKFDYVLVDVGPSAGALTRSFFLSCDMFLVPVAPDRFNYQAIRSLAEILRRWISEHKAVVEDFQKLKLNVPIEPPVFKGLVVQRFQRYRDAPKTRYQVWIDQIADRTRDQLIPVLDELAADVVPKPLRSQPAAIEIPDFASLGPLMLEIAKPVWKLTQEETEWRGSVWKDREAAMTQFGALFSQLAAVVDA